MGRLMIDIPRNRLADLCRRHHVRKLSLFGSVLRDDFGPDSDVDVLVEFDQGHTPGWEIIDIQDDFSTLFDGRRVDMVNPKYLNPRLRPGVLGTAVVQYDASDEA